MGHYLHVFTELTETFVNCEHKKTFIVLCHVTLSVVLSEIS